MLKFAPSSTSRVSMRLVNMRRVNTSRVSMGRASMVRVSIGPSSTGRSASASRIIVRSGASVATKGVTARTRGSLGDHARLSSPARRARSGPLL